MKLSQNKISIFLFLFFSSLLFSSTVEINGYKLEIKESSGRFVFSMKNGDGEYISVFSDDDSRTSSFSIFEENGFYTLGETFRYRNHFEETSDGGIFYWTSKNLNIKQIYSLDSEGFLSINFYIMNISKDTKSVGIKLLIDTAFEQDDHFYLKQNNGSLEIETEFEVEDPDKVQYWTSGVRNSKGASFMMIPTKRNPSRIIFGNWDLLDDADYYYRTASGRDFNNPPYSINDSAVVYFYSPDDVLSQNGLELSLCLRAIKTVENHNEIVFREKSVEPESIPEIVAVDEEVEIIPEPELLPVVKTIEEAEPLVIEAPEEESESLKEEEAIPVTAEEPEEEIVSQEPESLEPEETEVIIQLEKNQILEKKINTVSEISTIIETLSKPGIIDQNYLFELEAMINKLEEIDIDEN